VKFTADISYDAPPKDVYAMLVDPTFQDDVCRATGALEHTVDVREAGDGATITTTRVLPADGLPDFVRTFVGSRLEVRRVDEWSAADAEAGRHGSVVVEISGTPVRLTGTLRLAAQDGGSVEHVVGDLKASVPLLGGKVERAAEPAIRAAIAKEQEIGTEWLGR
jgi:hypothetical protein